MKNRPPGFRDDELFELKEFSEFPQKKWLELKKAISSYVEYLRQRNDIGYNIVPRILFSVEELHVLQVKLLLNKIRNLLSYSPALGGLGLDPTQYYAEVDGVPSSFIVVEFMLNRGKTQGGVSDCRLRPLTLTEINQVDGAAAYIQTQLKTTSLFTFGLGVEVESKRGTTAVILPSARVAESVLGRLPYSSWVVIDSKVLTEGTMVVEIDQTAKENILISWQYGVVQLTSGLVGQQGDPNFGLSISELSMDFTLPLMEYMDFQTYVNNVATRLNLEWKLSIEHNYHNRLVVKLTLTPGQMYQFDIESVINLTSGERLEELQQLADDINNIVQSGNPFVLSWEPMVENQPNGHKVKYFVDSIAEAELLLALIKNKRQISELSQTAFCEVIVRLN